jgi:hypothetical protein
MPRRRVPPHTNPQYAFRSRMTVRAISETEKLAPPKAINIDDFNASPWIGLHYRHELLLHHKHESLEHHLNE